MKQHLNRCAWANVNDPLMQKYHDQEWGHPLHDSQKLFELLSLEIMQAGLSWRTVLHKRAAFEQVFHHFDYYRVSRMSPDLPRLMSDQKIIRNRLKLKALINNAKVVNQMNQNGITFNQYWWNFVNNQPIINHYQHYSDVPKQTALSQRISQNMKRHGFKFTGPVIIYAFMEANGMVNDHTMDCFLRN